MVFVSRAASARLCSASSPWLWPRDAITEQLHLGDGGSRARCYRRLARRCRGAPSSTLFLASSPLCQWRLGVGWASPTVLAAHGGRCPPYALHNPFGFQGLHRLHTRTFQGRFDISLMSALRSTS